MACGCPSVTTDVGAVPEFAVDAQNARVVRVGDIDAMVNALEEVLVNAAFRNRLAAAARQTADTWSLARVAPLFTDATFACDHARVARRSLGRRGDPLLERHRTVEGAADRPHVCTSDRRS
jgi:hypothetical protein